MMDKLTSSDIIYKIASYCDLIELSRIECINHAWRNIALLIYDVVIHEHASIIHHLTYKTRTDFSSSKEYAVSAWRSYRHHIGKFLLVGGCFVGDTFTESCLIECLHHSKAGNTHSNSNDHHRGDDTSPDHFHLRCTGLSVSKLGASSSVTAPSGHRLLLGGWDNETLTCSSDILSLDPRQNPLSWESTVNTLPSHTPLCFTAATTTIDGHIIFTGGGTSPYRGAMVSSLCHRGYHDPSGMIGWDPLPDFNTPRCGHAVVTLYDDTIVALGGYAGDTSYLSSMEYLSIERGRWLPLPSMKYQRSGAGCVIGPDGCIYVVGGSPDGTVGHPYTERYDHREGKWVELASMMVGRGYTASCMGANMRLYASGGLQDDVVVNTIECYDIRMDRWTVNMEDSDNIIQQHHPMMQDGDGWDHHDARLFVRAGHQMMYMWE